MLLVGTCIFLAGCVGGLLNAFFPHQALVLPRIRTIRGRRTLEPGWVGNVAVGGIAALADRLQDLKSADDWRSAELAEQIALQAARLDRLARAEREGAARQAGAAVAGVG